MGFILEKGRTHPSEHKPASPLGQRGLSQGQEQEGKRMRF